MPENPSRTVFVVDDEPGTALAIAAILNASGFQATAFTNAEKLMQAAESCCPSILISDVFMPQINGIELAIRFKAAYPKCKILLFSGNASADRLMEVATEQGHAFTLMSKAILPDDLVAAVAKL
jgi:DNA-binding NtrC family response regulator